MKKGKNNLFWIKDANKTLTSTKFFLSNLSVKVRTDQYDYFKKLLKFSKTSKILDVGVSSDETLKDTNIFERLYPHSNNLTVATIEDSKFLRKRYPNLNKIVKITPGKKLPFKNKQFDIVVSWAVLEHVGDYDDQSKFLNELMRVGKKMFVTTPYRGCIYEPHTGLPVVQWLPLSIFRMLCRKLNRKYWADVKNLNPLYKKDIDRMNLNKKLDVIVYKMFHVLPSHLLIYHK